MNDLVSEQPELLFTSRRVGTTGHEILHDQEIVAWTADNVWAAIIVEALRRTTVAVSREDETDQ